MLIMQYNNNGKKIKIFDLFFLIIINKINK